MKSSQIEIVQTVTPDVALKRDTSTDILYQKVLPKEVVSELNSIEDAPESAQSSQRNGEAIMGDAMGDVPVKEDQRLSPYLLKLAPSTLKEVKQIAREKGKSMKTILTEFIVLGVYFYRARKWSPDAKIFLVEGGTVRVEGGSIRELVIDL